MKISYIRKTHILNIITTLFILLFIYAGLSKLLEYDIFKAQIGKSPLITSYSAIIVWLIPSVEFVVVTFLLIPRLLIIGLYGSFILMLSFTAYIGFIMTFSPYVPCSCGGILNNMGWGEHLIFNIAFTIIAFFGITTYVKINEGKTLVQTTKV